MSFLNDKIEDFNLPLEEGVEKHSGWETITIEKFHSGDRIKFMSFSVKASEKSNLTQLVMDLLITITQKEGYAAYFNSKAIDTLASKNFKP